MRAISRDAATALLRCRRFRRGNMRVSSGGGVSEMRLHGNSIAVYDAIQNRLHLSDCGWRTITTKERLNAVLSEFSVGHQIFQRNNQWYFGARNGLHWIWTGHFTFRAPGSPPEHDDPIHEVSEVTRSN